MFVNFFAVGAAAIVGFGIGALWYSPYLLGKEWAAVMGSAWKDGAGAYSPRNAMIIEFVATLITAYVLANLAVATGVHGPFAAIRLAVWVWLAFQATLLFSSVVFERRPMTLFYINAGERLMALLAMSIIVGVWR